jgi:hypothetical protein
VIWFKLHALVWAKESSHFTAIEVFSHATKLAGLDTTTLWTFLNYQILEIHIE